MLLFLVTAVAQGPRGPGPCPLAASCRALKYLPPTCNLHQDTLVARGFHFLHFLEVQGPSPLQRRWHTRGSGSGERYRLEHRVHRESLSEVVCDHLVSATEQGECLLVVVRISI